jgi:DNA-binding GntR family transcriptional regulator
MIHEGTLEPGSKIPERQLCGQFGISRTPLREAYRVLASEGLVSLKAHHSSRVAKLDAQEVDHIFEVMEGLEALAGELACERLDDAGLAAIHDLHRRMMAAYRKRDKARFFKLNQEIHERIIRASANPVLISTYEGLSGRMRRARFMALNTETQWRAAAAEHEAIMGALAARQRNDLSRLLRGHLRSKREKVKKLLAEQPD